MNYYCTCNGKNNSTSSKIRPVSVCKDGICLDCGYYAVACYKEVKDTAELYDTLRGMQHLEQYNDDGSYNVPYRRNVSNKKYKKELNEQRRTGKSSLDT